VVQLAHGQPTVVGRGRLRLAESQREPSLATLAYRQTYLTRAQITAAYTAKHGRHTPAMVPALALPLGQAGLGLEPAWAGLPGRVLACAAGCGGDLRLQLVGAGRAVVHGPSLRGLWQAQAQPRAWVGLVGRGGVTAGALRSHTAGSVFDQVCPSW
jgi:hypothetical protein